MLKFMRLHTKRIFVTILLLIIPAFCFFGLNMVMRSPKDNMLAGKLYGKPILVDRFFLVKNRTRSQMMAQMVLMFGIQNFDQLSALRNRINDLFTRENLNQLTWERLLLLHLVNEYDIPSDQTEVASWISRFPLFQINGRFDSTRYQMVVRNAFGVSPKIFEKDLKETLKITRLQDLATKNIIITDEEIQEAFQKENETLLAEYVLIENTGVSQNLSFKEEELKEYYQKNSELFRRPEEIQVEYFILDKDKIAKAVTVTPSAIQAFYTANIEKYRDPQTQKERPLYEVQTEIEELLKQNKAEDLFYEKTTEISIALIREETAAVAKDYDLELKKTPFFSREESPLPPSITEKVFSLEMNEFNRPLATPDGAYLVKPIQKKTSRIPSFEESKEAIIEKLGAEHLLQMTRKQAEQKHPELLKLMKEKDLSFSKAVKTLKLDPQQTAPFSRKESLSAVQTKIQALAFGLKLNELSPVIPTEKGALIFSVIEKSSPEYKEDLQLIAKIKNARRAALYQSWIRAKKKEANLVDLTPFF